MRIFGFSLGSALMAIPVFTAFLMGTARAQYSVQIDLGEQKAYLLYDDRAIMESPICSGRYGHLTPDGTFKIVHPGFVLNRLPITAGPIFEKYSSLVLQVMALKNRARTASKRRSSAWRIAAG